MSDVTAPTTHALVLRLMVKDIYMHRQMIIAALIGGLASLSIVGINQLGYSIGSVSFITTMMAFGVVLAMYSIAQERRDRSEMFVLSLPVAPSDYVRAKLLGTTVTYFIPWSVLSAGAVLVIAITKIPDGLIPLTILLLVYFLFTFSVMSAVALFVSSEAKMTFAIIFTNMSLTFFMFAVSRVHGIGFGLERGPAPAWTGSFFAVLAAELTLIVIALGTPLYFQPRGKDFV